ncbi:MAG: hypothetical protein ACSHXK_08665 [Oceanococcus sp.]
MTKTLLHTILVSLTMAILSCSGESGNADSADMTTICEDPRPEACTANYQPVCATRDNGVRCVTTPCDSTEMATYSNGCSACADERVFEYQDGACADENQ